MCRGPSSKCVVVNFLVVEVVIGGGPLIYDNGSFGETLIRFTIVD